MRRRLAVTAVLVALLSCRREEHDPVQSFDFHGVIRPRFSSSGACGGGHFQDSASFPESDVVWIVDGQTVCLYWDQLKTTIASASSPSGMRTCEFCAAADPCGAGATIPSGDVPRNEFPQVHLFEWPFPVFDVHEDKGAFGYAVGCPGNQSYPFSEYVPTRNADLMLQGWALNPPGDFIRGSRHLGVTLVPATGDFEMPPRILTAQPGSDPGTATFTWTVPQTGRIWDENFSPDLHITKIRNLRGTLETGSFVDAVGRKGTERLANPTPILPFNVGFGSDIHCDADPTTADGGIDLARCNKGGNILAVDATPGYQIVSGSPPAAILWSVGFRDRPPFTLPTLQPGETLAISFTLKSKTAP